MDAKADAIAFYERLGFLPLDVQSGHLGERPEPTLMFLELGAIPLRTGTPDDVLLTGDANSGRNPRTLAARPAASVLKRAVYGLVGGIECSGPVQLEAPVTFQAAFQAPPGLGRRENQRGMYRWSE